METSELKQTLLRRIRTKYFWDGVLIGFVGGLIFILIVRAVAV